MCGNTVPEELRVEGCCRAQHPRCVQVRRHVSGGTLADWRRELQDPEHHLRDQFFADPPEAASSEEPSFTKTCLLGSHNVFQHRGDGDFFTRLQVAVVDLIAVGRDDGRESGLVEDVRHPAQRIVGFSNCPQTAHRPYLRHRRRRDYSVVSGGAGGRFVDVDRVLVTDRLDPVADHRQVHGVPAGARSAWPVLSNPLGSSENGI